MSGMDGLQQRVQQVEQRLGLINEQRAKYSERLVDLMDAVETRLREQQAEIERQDGELAAQAEKLDGQTTAIKRAEGENEQLRRMLHSLLRAIEGGGRDLLSETMQALDTKVSALIDGNGVPSEAAQAPETDAADAPDQLDEPDEPDEPDETDVVMDAEPVATSDDPVVETDPLPEPEVVIAEDDATPSEFAEDGASAESELEIELDAAPTVDDGADAAQAPAREPKTDTVSLAAIMQRVSRLVDEDGALGTVAQATRAPAPKKAASAG